VAGGSPRARYRPRGQGFLVFERNARRIELPLDAERLDLPPQVDPRLAPPPVRAHIERIEGGHTLVPFPGSAVKVNHRLIARRTVLHGGDSVDVDGFEAQYTTAREELQFPMTVIVWPTEGPPVEIRSHRARLTIGAGDADIQVDDDTVDDVHCTIRRYANGVMQIQDEKSYNGTQLDGRRLNGSGPLRDGAEIRIGRTRLKAWAEASVHDSGALMGPVDAFDGLPQGGFDPKGGQGPLRPHAVEVGPDFIQTRRRTFDDDVPTRLEGWGERVDVRPTRRASHDPDAPRAPEGYGDAPRASGELPDWAPRDVNRPQPKAGGAPKPRGDDLEFGRHKQSGLTRVHGADVPRAPPRERRPRHEDDP